MSGLRAAVLSKVLILILFLSDDEQRWKHHCRSARARREEQSPRASCQK